MLIFHYFSTITIKSFFNFSDLEDEKTDETTSFKTVNHELQIEVLQNDNTGNSHSNGYKTKSMTVIIYNTIKLFLFAADMFFNPRKIL